MNYIHVSFADAVSIQTEPLWQYDDEQTIIFDDLDLPDQYEVHFANHKDTGMAMVQIGTAEGELNATVYFKDGTTTTVTEGRKTHPGNLGMERIADAIIAKLDM